MIESNTSLVCVINYITRNVNYSHCKSCVSRRGHNQVRQSQMPKTDSSALFLAHNYQLLDKVEQNIVNCQWREDQLFANAEGRGK